MAMRRMNEMWGRIALALVLSVLLFHSCQGQDEIPDTTAAADQGDKDATVAPNIADADSQSTEASKVDETATVEQSQSGLDTALPTATAPAEKTNGEIVKKTEEEVLGMFDNPDNPVTEKPEIAGHGMNTQSSIIVSSKIEVTCVDEERVKEKNSVKLELKSPSNCSETIEKLSKLADLCLNPSCKFEVFQEENSKDVIVSGNGVEGNIDAVTNKLRKHLGVENIETERAKQPVVLVILILVGLAMAAVGIALYVWKHHRTNAKGMKLAEESVMADEENQGNTLVSVAPLNPPEPQEKPSQNGESPEAVKTQNPPAATNGHSATKTADTEL